MGSTNRSRPGARVTLRLEGLEGRVVPAGLGVVPGRPGAGSETSPPTAVDDQATLAGTVSVRVRVLDNDVAGSFAIDPTRVQVIGQPARGSTSVDPVTGDVVYYLRTGESGIDEFQYTVADEFGSASNPARVLIDASGPQGPPPGPGPVYAYDDSAVTTGPGPVTINILFNDVSAVAPLDRTSVAVVSGPSHGTASVDPATGVVTYTPAAGYVGPDNFQYTVKDTRGNLSNTARVTLRLPVVAANDDLAVTASETPAVIDPVANDTAEFPLRLDRTSVAITSGPAHGRVSVDPLTGRVTYTPQVGYVGPDEFRYTVRDVGGYGSSSGLVTVVVTPSGPQLRDDPAGGRMLVVHGTAAADRILISQSGPYGDVAVWINGVYSGSFAPTGRILVFGGAGDDHVTVTAGVGRPAWVFGGNGDDLLIDRSPGGVLVGGAGRDQLLGWGDLIPDGPGWLDPTWAAGYLVDGDGSRRR